MVFTVHQAIQVLTRFGGSQALRACLKIQFWVARATGLCHPATRRTERERQLEPMDTAFSQRCSRKFRSAGRRPEGAGRPRHPFSKEALREHAPAISLK